MSKKSTNWLRLVLQWGTLILIISFLFHIFGNKEVDPEAYCPMGGLESLSTYLVRGSLACTMTTVQIMMGVALTLGVIFFGKLFCSYLCPVGLIDEQLRKIRIKFHLKAIIIKRGSLADGALRFLKYALLFVTFYMTMSSSELFCKNFDPYYALASGFNPDVTVWMASISFVLLFLGGLFVDMFWCKYICPLGAISNLFKFSIWTIALICIYFILTALLGVNIPWLYLLLIACISGYILEVFVKHPLSPKAVAVNRNDDTCTNCGLCVKKCPYNIDMTKVNTVKEVDCNLCGECVEACNTGALTMTKKKWGKWLPGIIAIVLFLCALWIGNTLEIPTVEETWGIEEMQGNTKDSLKTFKMVGLTSVKCFSSSTAFKNKLTRVKGVHGVKTFVKHHEAVITYDPTTTTENDIREAVFVPSSFKVQDPPMDLEKLKIVTIRTEGMNAASDLNMLGLKFRHTDYKVYGVESIFGCPLYVKVFMDPSEDITKKQFKAICEQDTMNFILHTTGKIKVIDNLSYDFVRIDPNVDTIALRPFLEKMFHSFKAEFRFKDQNGKIHKQVDRYKDQAQAYLEFPDKVLEKPFISRNFPYLSNWLSQDDSVIGMYVVLNDDNIPAIRIRYAVNKTTPEKILERIRQPKWTIQYNDGPREMSAAFTFKKDPIVIPITEDK